jgi:oligopeptide transport system substrate-binding protein
MLKKWYVKLTTALALLLAAIPLMSACQNSHSTGSGAGGGSVKQEITLNAATEPPSLDPAIASDTTSGWIINHLFEGLYTKDKNGNIVKGLAKDVKVSDDKKTYTFTLKDAKWTDGNPVTAQDFEYSWKRVLNPETGSPFAFYMYYIKGAEDYNKGKGSADNVGVKALDDKTLEVQLNAPTAFLDKLLAFWTYYPVEKSVVENNKNWASEAKTFVSDGPYKLAKWDHNNQVIAVKNDKYYNKDDVNMEKITWKMVNDANTYYQMYKSGELDVINTLPSDVIAQEKNSKEFKVTPYFGIYMFMFNIKKEPFNNLKVRQAFNLAIDREALTKQITKGGETPAYAMVPFGVKAPDGRDYRETKEAYFKEDVKKAKTLLKEAMQEEGWSKLPPVTLLYNTSDSNKKIAEAVQEMLSKNLNIKINIQNQEWKTFLDTTDQKNYQMARMGWIGVYVDPVPILDYYLGDSPNNRTNWNNKEYDRLMAQAKVTQDETKRFELLHQAEDVLMKDLPFIPVYYYTQNYLVSPKVKGLYFPTNGFPYVRWAKMTN